MLDLDDLKYFCDNRVYLKIFKEKQLNLWYHQGQFYNQKIAPIDKVIWFGKTIKYAFDLIFQSAIHK